jgi:hypothetical protein
LTGLFIKNAIKSTYDFNLEKNTTKRGRPMNMEIKKDDKNVKKV